MKPLSKLGCAMMLLWAAVFALSPPAAHSQQSRMKRVLVLYWENQDHPANIEFAKNLRAALESSAPGRIEYYSEYLEASRFPGEKTTELLRDYMLQKYAGRTMDVVVATEAVALDFLFKYRSELFPGTPIVFASTQRPSDSQLTSGGGATGITFLTSYRKTVDLAMKLHPGTQRVFIVSKTPPAGDSWEKLARSDLQGFNDAAITYLTDLPLEELRAKLRALPERSIVLYVWVRLPIQASEFLESRDVLSSIAPSVRVPIYGLSFANIGRGIVGGYVWTMESRTHKMAELILKVANGVRPADLPVENTPLVPMFDWRELERWRIDEDLLPPGSVVRFRELTFWQQYKWRIVGSAAVVVLQAILIGALLVHRKQAKRRAAALVEAQRVLQENEERFRRVFEEGPLGLALVGRDHRFVKVNGALCRMVGYDEAELVQKTFDEITHPDDVRADAELADRLFKREIPVYRIQKRYVKRSGEIIWINLTASIILRPDGEPLYGLAMVEDITDIKRTQEEALLRQKLESLGTLAGGIAHDFNNLLGAVHAQAELASTELDAGSSCKEELNSIRQVAMRGAEIVRQLMIYAGAESADVELVDLSKTVDEMLSLLGVSVTKHAVIKTQLERDLPPIRVSAAQLRQIVMNLITNASDAIGNLDGVIGVRTRRLTLKGESTAITPRTLPNGDYVQLEISDTGRGMSPEIQAKAFDPFFTTKSAGRGLGLAVVQGIVRGLGGAIGVMSEPGKGTTFQILLPGAEGAAGSSGPAILAVEKSAAPSEHGTVLVVEDEAQLRQAVVKMLRKTGFKVFEASDGSSAIDLLRADGGKIDVILLDMTIPGASFYEVVAEAANAKPNIRVILTSAYSQETIASAASPAQIHRFIRKPYQFEDLLNTLRTSLSQ